MGRAGDRAWPTRTVTGQTHLHLLSHPRHGPLAHDARRRNRRGRGDGRSLLAFRRSRLGFHFHAVLSGVAERGFDGSCLQTVLEDLSRSGLDRLYVDLMFEFPYYCMVTVQLE